MNALALLEEQHRDVEKNFDEFKKAAERDDAQQKLELFHLIANKLAIHCTIEEKIFYPNVYLEETESKLNEAVEEHLGAKRLIADLLDLDAADDRFEAKVSVLEEQVRHHVEEEEGTLFPEVKRSFTTIELEMMGAQMQALAEELETGEPSALIPGELDQPVTLQ